MGRPLIVLLPLMGLLGLGYAAKCPEQLNSPGREILCYTTSNDVELLQDSICKCTAIVHQGHDLKDLSTSGIKEFQKTLKEMNPTLQIVLSVSDDEGSLKTSARIRQEAAARIVRVLNEVDGIELNITAGTKERLVHFVQGLKTEMVRKSKDKRILLVLPTKPEELAKQFDLKALSKYVNLFTLPTHYLVDDEEAFRTFHPSRLMGLFDMLNADSLVDLVTGLGLEKRKILMSLPASVYKFALEKNDENAPRAPTKGKLPVQISRTEMCETMSEGDWIVERDEDLTAPYAFKDDTWMAFEDKISAGIKGKYVLLRELAGLGIHNVEKDLKTKCGNSVAEDVYHSFTDNTRKTREAVLTSLQEDLQQTQIPYSDHIKSSGFRISRIVDTNGHIHAMRENTQTEFSCPRQGYFVHPKSCNRFYRCVKFNQGLEEYSVFEFDCPAGLAFDESTEVCVWPGTITACSGSSEIAPSKDAKFTCPDHPGYYADPHNCRFFYACYDLGEHGLTSYEFRCPYGLVFDEEKLICQWPYLVPSCGGGTYERPDYEGKGHDGSNQGGHGGHGGGDEGGHGGYGGKDESGHGGHGGYGGGDEGGHGGYGGNDESGHGGHGGYGGGDEGGYGGHGGSGEGGHGGYGGGDKGGHGGHGGSGQGGHGGYGGGDEGGHGGHGGSGQEGHGGHGGGDEGGHGGHGGSGQGGHGGYGGGDEGGHGGYGGYGGKDQGGDGGYGGKDESGHGGYGGKDEGGHGGYGGKDEGGHGGYGGKDDSGHGGYGGKDEGGHGGYGGKDEGGHGGYGGKDEGGHGGYGGKDEGGDGGYGGKDEGGHGGYGGKDEGGHGGYGGKDEGGDGGYGGKDEGGHGGYGGKDEGGDGGYGGKDEGGHGGYGGKDEGGDGGYGGKDEGGHGGYGGKDEGGDGGYGGKDEGGHGGYGGKDEGGHGGNGGKDEGGHGGYGGKDEGGHGGYGGKDEGGDGGYGGKDGGGHGGYGGKDEGGHGGYGGKNEGGHGGYGGKDEGGDGGYRGQDEGGYGGKDEGGYGGKDEGGHGGKVDDGHGGYGGKDESAHGGYGGKDESSHGGYDGKDESGHGGFEGKDEAGHGGYGGKDEGGHDGSNQSGHGGYGGKDEDVHGGSNEGGHGGHGGRNEHGHDGSTKGGHDGSSKGGHGGSNQGHGVYVEKEDDGHGGSTKGGHGGSHEGGHGGHGDSDVSEHENGHTGSYTKQGGFTSSYDDSHRGGAKGSYTTSTQGGYTIDSKYPASSIGYSPAPGADIFTNAGGHQSNAGFTTIDTGVHTGIYSGGYDGHTPTIQYSGQTRPGVTYEIEETTRGSISEHTGTPIYHGGFSATGSQGYRGSYTDNGISGGSVTGSYGGSQGATSAGSATYHGNFGSSGYTTGSGSISNGAATQGFIGTGDSTSGTVYTHAGGSGIVLTGNQEQGGIIAGITQPGYVRTHDGTPGYVVTDGVKNYYDSSSSKGTFTKGIPGHPAIITGSPAPGVVLTGNSSPGTYIAGQTSGGVIVGGGVTPVASSGHSSGSQYYTGGSGTSIYNTRGQSNASKTPNYQNNPFLGQTSPTVISGDGSYGSNSGNYYTGGSGTSVYYGGSQTPFISGSKTPNYQNNPFLGQTSPTVITGGSSFGSNGGTYYAGGSGTSIYNGASGSRGQTTFTSAPNFPKYPVTSVTGDSGYKTNEYHDNGGRGTIRYNNGEVSHKFTEDDVRDHRTQFGTNPTFDVKSYEASRSKQGTFTKTGPTKTGIVTAQVGGSGTYITGSTQPRPFTNTQSIGANAFGSNSGKTSNNLSYGTSPSAPNLKYTTQQTNYDTGSIDASKINLGSTSGKSSPSYSYTRPSLPLNTFDATKAPISSGIPGFPTNAPPFLDVHVYNSPSVVTSAPITAYPAVVNTYSYNKPSSVQQTGYSASSGAASTGKYSRPVATDQRKFPSVSSTITPAVRPTPFSVGGNTNGYGYSQTTGSHSLSTKGNSALDINVSFQKPDYSTQGQYDNGDTIVPADIGSSGYNPNKSRRPSVTQSVTSKRPTVQQAGSGGSSQYSESIDYNDYSHTQTGGTFGQRVSQGVSVTPSLNYATPTQTYKGPSSSVRPSTGVTYRTPFHTPTSTTPFKGYSYTTPSAKFVATTESSISYKQEGSYATKSTKSPTNLDIPRTEVEKLVTNYDRGSAKYTPSGYETYSDNTGEHETSKLRVDGSSDYDFSKSRLDVTVNGDSSSSARPHIYSSTAPSVTTYSGNYNRGPSTPSYEATGTSKPKGKGKVIVKFSDLHPLLLGKLGAECTCKADPFASFRGSKPLPINSSKGRVDLRNYDESEVYVDLETSKENGDYSNEYNTYSEGSTPANYDDGKYETPVVAVFDGVTPSGRAGVKSKRPSSNYQSGRSSSTYLPPHSSTSRPPSSTYLPVTSPTKHRPVSSTYLPPSSNNLPSARLTNRAGAKASFSANDRSISVSFPNARAGGFRAGKNLGDSPTGNALQGAGFDGFGSGSLHDVDDTVQGTGDCTRSGLFRHPNFCNKFYACHWDDWKKKFTLHVFNCPVHLTFDSGASACNWPSKGPACQDGNLLV